MEKTHVRSFREIVAEILQLQVKFSPDNTPEMGRRGILLRYELPIFLGAYRKQITKVLGRHGSDFDLEGKDGTGRKTFVPWIRFCSKRKSPSPTDGWYCVFLFHAQGNGFYLCLIHGSTQFVGGSFVPRSDEELKNLVGWARDVIRGRYLQTSGMTETIHLGNAGKLAESYERGTALAKWYPADAIPSNEELIADVCAFARLLRVIYDEIDLENSPGASTLRETVEIDDIFEDEPAAPRGGQGTRLSGPERAAVEARAMLVAREHLISDGYSVEDVSKSKTHSCDFVATKGSAKIIVEVKGTTSGAGEIILTTNEVEKHIREHPNNALIVVHGIMLDRTTIPPTASIGTLKVVQPWLINRDLLRPRSFYYELEE